MLDLLIVKKDFASLMGNINPWMLSHFIMWLDIKVAEYKVYGHMVLDDTLNDTPKWLISQRSVQQSTDHTENVQAKTQPTEVLKRQTLTQSEESPPPAKQQRISHDQNRYTSPQSSQIPQGHTATGQGHNSTSQSLTNRPMPSLIRQPSNYRTENSAITQHSNEKQLTQVTVNDSSSNLLSQHEVGQFVENASVQDILNNINLSQIQLQQRWSQEIEKSISQSGVKAIKVAEKDNSGTTSRSTIVLGDPVGQIEQNEELQNRLSFDTTQKDSSKNVQEETTELIDQDMIKIELSSDDESQTGNTYSHTGETTSVSDTGQEDSFRSTTAVDFSNPYSLQESNLREVVDDLNPVPVSMYSSNDKSPSKNILETQSVRFQKVKQYKPKTRPGIESAEYIILEPNQSAPDGFIRLSPGTPLAVKSLWMSNILATIGRNREKRNKKGSILVFDEKSETVKRLMDGFYDPWELADKKGTTSFNEDPIFLSLRCKSEDETSWRNKKWEYFEKLRKSQNSSYVGARVHSQSLQNLLPFPDPFPLDNLTYGDRAREMINSGNITRSGKMQFLDTVFNEVVKYTGLYPSPQQKIDIAKAIVTSFPKLDTKTHPGHASAIDQWLVIINDKFRNERRMLHHGPYLSRQRIPGLQYLMTNTEMSEDS